jgi:hypothetical protein
MQTHQQYLQERQRLSLYTDLRSPILTEARFIRAELEKPIVDPRGSDRRAEETDERKRLAHYSNLMKYSERQWLLTIQVR